MIFELPNIIIFQLISLLFIPHFYNSLKYYDWSIVSFKVFFFYEKTKMHEII